MRLGHQRRQILLGQIAENGAVAGDFFVDCTGNAALVIGERLGVPFLPCGDTLFNDRALVAQVPVASDSPIASQTNAVAHRAGWIWDIGLPTRRGMGCVYSSAYMRDDEAETVLRGHIARSAPDCDAADLPVRRLNFRSGYRERFWERNCLTAYC